MNTMIYSVMQINIYYVFLGDAMLCFARHLSGQAPDYTGSDCIPSALQHANRVAKVINAITPGEELPNIAALFKVGVVAGWRMRMTDLSASSIHCYLISVHKFAAYMQRYDEYRRGAEVLACDLEQLLKVTLKQKKRQEIKNQHATIGTYLCMSFLLRARWETNINKYNVYLYINHTLTYTYFFCRFPCGRGRHPKGQGLCRVEGIELPVEAGG